MGARKKATRRRAAPKPPPPLWKRAAEWARASTALWAAIAMLALASQYIVRHFAAGEKVPAIEQAVATLADIHEDEAEIRAYEQERAKKEREGLERDCTLGVLTLGECARRSLGPLHPDYRAGVKR